MFDRPPPSPPASRRPSPAASEASATPEASADSVERLCRLYDARLARADGRLSPDHRRDLGALAGLFGLDAERPVAELWRELRSLILRRASADQDSTPEPAETPTAVRSDAAAEPLTLLVVEDDPETAVDLTAFLTEAGHRVVGPFHSAAAAEAAAALHPVDAALLDINLSDGADGGALAENLARRWGVRIIFVSGDGPAVERHAHLAEAVVIKPYTGAQILAAVARLSPA
ncbi:MAG: response regulator receiver protein [Caulobacterales bacterium RIFOXYB1_FULL_67_16]|nr:MAG: response regulator receiver protein [Caulobacterales bacterium RIFOXYB1_FULL_67_16]